jgi:hypothetical protein
MRSWSLILLYVRARLLFDSRQLVEGISNQVQLRILRSNSVNILMLIVWNSEHNALGKN